MSVIIAADQLRALALGTRVANASPKTVPQAATATVFTVTGGRVLVTSLTGVVTTVIAGTTPALKLVATPTVGTANDICGAATITADEVGTQYAVAGTSITTALNTSGNGSGAVYASNAAFSVATGTIGHNVSAADATGAIRWTLTYVALDNGASVTAA
jgi:hypothetical protein